MRDQSIFKGQKILSDGKIHLKFSLAGAYPRKGQSWHVYKYLVDDFEVESFWVHCGVLDVIPNEPNYKLFARGRDLVLGV